MVYIYIWCTHDITFITHTLPLSLSIKNLSFSSSNLYDLLGVSRNASTREIWIAYLQRAQEFHPDKNLWHEVDTIEIFTEIHEAYRILGDSELRAEYNGILALSMVNQLYFMEAGETPFYLHDKPAKGPNNDELFVIKETERYP